MDLLVGKVTHYFDKIEVAIVEVLNQPLKTGDTVKFSGHDQEFNQKITSMQVEHEQIQKATLGTIVAIKIAKPVKQNDQVFLVS